MNNITTIKVRGTHEFLWFVTINDGRFISAGNGVHCSAYNVFPLSSEPLQFKNSLKKFCSMASQETLDSLSNIICTEHQEFLQEALA